MKDLTQPSTHQEHREVEEAGNLSPRIIYEVVRRAGQEEMGRPLNALIWSGIAAGILMSFSVIGEAALHDALPDTPWRAIIENFGYTLGFLLVILGRMQLFTENTITTVLPVLTDPSPGCRRRMARLWMVVLGANVVGAFLVAGFYSLPGTLPEGVYLGALEVSGHAVGLGAWDAFVRGVPAGVLIAALVWILAPMRSGQVAVIILVTWLIAMGDFTHIIAGTVEYALVVFRGEMTLLNGLLQFWLPVLAGNVLGGTLVFSALAWRRCAPTWWKRGKAPASADTGL